MRSELIPALCVPGGGAALRLARAERVGDGEVLEGGVYAWGRGFFPLRAGVLDLLPAGAGVLTQAQQSNLLGVTAAFYELWRRRSLTLLSGTAFGLRREMALVREYFGPPGAGVVLDLAASTGLYGRALAAGLATVGGSVVGLDLALPMLRVARREASREGHGNMGFVRARAEALPFADGQLVGALCGGSLNEFGREGMSPAVVELRRALAPGAPAVFMHLIAATGAAGRTAQQLLTAGGLVFPPLSETNRLFKEAGFSVTRQEQHGVVVFSRLV